MKRQNHRADLASSVLDLLPKHGFTRVKRYAARHISPLTTIVVHFRKSGYGAYWQCLVYVCIEALDGFEQGNWQDYVIRQIGWHGEIDMTYGTDGPRFLSGEDECHADCAARAEEFYHGLIAPLLQQLTTPEGLLERASIDLLIPLPTKQFLLAHRASQTQ